MAIDTLAQWHKIIKDRDLGALDRILAENVVFLSPVVHTPQSGKQLAKLYLAGAFHVLLNGSFHYVRELVARRDAVLEFSATVDGIIVNGVDMIRWNEEGLIEEIKVMLRPLKAINLMHQKMGALLADMKRGA